MSSYSLPTLKEKIGTSRPAAQDLQVEAGKVEEFARAIGEDNPAFRSEVAATNQGFDRVPAPMTFTRTQMFPRYRPDGVESDGFDLGFDEANVVHGEQEYEFERPLYVGETLTGTATLVDVYTSERSGEGTMTFAEVETEYRNQDDEPVVLARKTIIEINTDGADE